MQENFSAPQPVTGSGDAAAVESANQALIIDTMTQQSVAQPAPTYTAPPSEHWDRLEPSPSPSLSMPIDDKPVPVVKVLSVRGVEYLFMTLSLWFGASALVSILLAIANGEAGFDVLAFPLSLLIVVLPIFAFLFLRLRKAELADPGLRWEASKRRMSQITQVVTFLICVFTLIALLNFIFIAIGGSYEGSIGKLFLNAAIILTVAGGILVYYWIDEHKLVK